MVKLGNFQKHSWCQHGGAGSGPEAELAAGF
jgi:hypothetical protein